MEDFDGSSSFGLREEYFYFQSRNTTLIVFRIRATLLRPITFLKYRLRITQKVDRYLEGYFLSLTNVGKRETYFQIAGDELIIQRVNFLRERLKNVGENRKVISKLPTTWGAWKWTR